MAQVQVVNSVSKMRRNLLRTSVLSGGLMLVAVPQVMAGCVDTANSTTCANDAVVGVILPNTTVSNNLPYLLELNNYQVTNGGISISAHIAQGDISVVLANGSSITGGVPSYYGGSGIGVNSASGSNVSVELLDTSSVSGDYIGIIASTGSFFESSGLVSIKSDVGSIIGVSGSGIYANSDVGVDVDVGGSVTGGTFGIQTSSRESIKIQTGTGGILGGSSQGIYADAFFGTVEVKTGGNVTGSSGIVTYGDSRIETAAGYQVVGTSTAGIIANNGLINIDAGGKVFGEQIGVYSSTYKDVNVVTRDLVQAENGIGILISNFGFSGNVSIDAKGNVVGGNGSGINAFGYNTVDIKTAGNVTSYADEFSRLFGDQFGIVVYGAKDVSISTAAGKTVFSTSDEAIYAVAHDSIRIDSNSIALSELSSGISARLEGYPNGDIEIVATADVTGKSGSGIKTDSTRGDTSIKTGANAKITGLVGDGIFATGRNTWTQASEGAFTIEAEGDVAGSNNGIGVFGGYGVISVTANGEVSGLNGDGIIAESALADVSVTTGAESIIRSENGAGIFATAFYENNYPSDSDPTSNVTVDSKGAVLGETVGIETFTHLGNTNINASGSVRSESGSGIIAETHSGKINVSTTGSSVVQGLGGHGIYAFNTHSGDVRISSLGNVLGSASGIKAISEDGFAEVITGDGSISGETGDGVFVFGATKASFTNNGLVRGLEHGLFSLSFGQNDIVNNGVIENLSGASSDLALATGYSSATLINSSSGSINGRIELWSNPWSEESNSFANQGLWHSSGLSYFDASADQLSNSGVVQFSGTSNLAETTTFSGLETFENAGVLSGMDQASGDGSTTFDSLSLSGDYIGSDGAILALDVYLGGPGSLADVLTIDGHTSGRTLVRLRNTNAGPGAINDAGIVLVKVAGTSSAADFALEGGPVTSGLYAYDLEYRTHEAGASFALVSAPSAQAGELVELVDGLQNIWSGGMNAWSLRQATLRDVIAGRKRITAVSSDGLTENAGVQQVWAAPRGEWSKRDTAGAFGSTAHRQSTYGLDGGVDFAVEVAPDAQLLFGLVGGYATSRVNFLDSASGIDIEGGSLGAYAGFVADGFFANALLKHDWMDLDYTAAGTGSAKTDARSLGLAADVGYRFGTGASFVEPLVSFSTIQTKADAFTLGGSLVTPGKNTATRVGAGVRFGVNEGVFNSLFTLRAWESFGGENQLGFGTAAIPIVASSQGMTLELASQLSVNLSEQTKVFVNSTTYLSNEETAASFSAGLTAQW